MSSPVRRYCAVPLCCLLIVLAACEPGGFSATEDLSVRPRSYHRQIVLAGFSGRVELLPSAEEDLKLAITRRAAGRPESECRERISDIRLAIDSVSSASLVVELDVPTPAAELDYGVDIRAQVPAGIEVLVFNVDGPVAGRDLTQSVKVRARNAAVKLERISGDVDVATSDSSVTLVPVYGSVDVVTSGAPVLVTATLPESSGHCRVQSSDGDLTLRVPVATSATVYARTAFGVVSVAGLPMEYARQEPDFVQGILRTGSNEVYLTTSNAGIYITAW
jgi:hypothetical protein